MKWCEGNVDFVKAMLTSLQKRTAETLRAQRTLKTNCMDAQQSMRVRDSLWHPSLRTLRLSGDLPFLQRTLQKRRLKN